MDKYVDGSSVLKNHKNDLKAFLMLIIFFISGLLYVFSPKNLRASYEMYQKTGPFTIREIIGSVALCLISMMLFAIFIILVYISITLIMDIITCKYEIYRVKILRIKEIKAKKYSNLPLVQTANLLFSPSYVVNLYLVAVDSNGKIKKLYSKPLENIKENEFYDLYVYKFSHRVFNIEPSNKDFDTREFEEKYNNKDHNKSEVIRILNSIGVLEGYRTNEASAIEVLVFIIITIILIMIIVNAIFFN